MKYERTERKVQRTLRSVQVCVSEWARSPRTKLEIDSFWLIEKLKLNFISAEDRMMNFGTFQLRLDCITLENIQFRMKNDFIFIHFDDTRYCSSTFWYQSFHGTLSERWKKFNVFTLHKFFSNKNSNFELVFVR